MTPAQAYSRVKTAIKSGKLIKPKVCGRCNTNPGRGKDGRSLLHGHHHDYTKPLDVEWLCTRCHRKETRLAIGAENGNAVLTAGLAEAARILVREGFSIIEIAEFYGMSRSGLSHALCGRTYWLAERTKGAGE